MLAVEAEVSDSPAGLDISHQSEADSAAPSCLFNRLYSADGIRAVLKEFSQSARERLENLKILVLDDVPHDAQHASDKLSVLETDYGATVHVATDAESTVQLVIDAAASGEPYDVIISDCQMKTYDFDDRPSGINGDQFAKLVAAGLSELGHEMPPIVFHSGSHASGLQAFLWKEVERGRRLGEALADQAADKCIEEFPLTLIDKRDPPLALIEAINQVLRVHSECDPEKYTRYISESLKISSIESDFDTQTIGHMARIVHLFSLVGRSCYEELLQLGVPAIEDMKLKKYFDGLRESVEEFESDRFHFDKLVGNSDRAAETRHSINGAMQPFFAELSIIGQQLREQSLPSDNPLAEKIRAADSVVSTAHQSLNTLAEAFKYYQYLRKQPHIDTIDLKAEFGYTFAHGEKEGVSFEVTSEPLFISGPKGVIETLLVQPYFNSLKFTPIDNRNIRVCLNKVALSDLDSQVAEWLQEELALEGASHVACLSVHDNGCGISEENLPKIFNYGFSTSQTLPGGIKSGWGLGLLGEKIGQFGGVCYVKSKPGSGTDFYIFFKLADPPQS